MKKLKTMIMSAAMLLGMGLAAVPQAMAGGSVFATYKLPFGLQFGEPIPKKAKFQFQNKDTWVASIYSGKNHKIYKRGKTLGAQTIDGGLQSLFFSTERLPRSCGGCCQRA